MLRFRSIPALLALTTFFGGSAQAQLFRRDDPAADKAKQQQQQAQKQQQTQKQQAPRSSNDPRQKSNSPANKTPNNSANTGLNNQSNRAGQINRNNSTAQPNKAPVPKNVASSNVGATENNSAPANGGARANNSGQASSGLSGRYQAPVQNRPGAPQSSAQYPAQQSAQKLVQQSMLQGARGTNQPPNSQALNARPVPAANAFAPSPVSQPAGLAGNNSSSLAPVPTQGLEANGANQIGDIANTVPQVDVQNSAISSVSEEDIVDRFGIVLNPNGDDIVVARIKPGAFAATAGLRIDDKITSIGGAPVSNRSEFYEIARLLSLGDQIEIEFDRGGKAEKSFIQYGASAEPNSPVADATALGQTGSIQLGSDSGWTAATEDRSARLEQQVIAQQRIIQELQERIRQLEAERAKKF